MIGRATAILAVAASAAGFSPMMSMDLGRREIVQAGAAAAIAAPLLRPAEAEAKANLGMSSGNAALSRGIQKGFAPIITIMDHRGCSRGQANREYQGKKSGDQDDEMLVKVKMDRIPVDYNRATAQLQESISYKAKGIDGPYTGEKDLSIYKVPGSSVSY